ncbi:threonine synthase [Bacteroidia bacterium]|nr:threonine synthase [Bacteroidia bacterium]
MKYYSTNKNVPEVSLKEAVLRGLAADNGLYMPAQIARLPASFFATLAGKTLQEISCEVATALFDGDLPEADLQTIVCNAINFEIPLVKVTDNIYSLELFHGPTLAFKDVGARFLAQLMGYFTAGKNTQITVLVATSGDTGSAVANGFLGIPGIRVVVLYPKNRVSKIQESQFTTLGQNVVALEVAGTFDDCQQWVKQAFLDNDLQQALTLTSANSINLARLAAQVFYYFWAYTQMPQDADVVCSVPSGNFGNLTAGLIAQRMGLPIRHFIAANNRNDIFYQYIATQKFTPRASIATIANAMDVGNPSNFARIMDLYQNSHSDVAANISAYCYNDDEIGCVMQNVHRQTGYTLDPHGACGYEALRSYLQEHKNARGFFLETAHPAKFKDTVDNILHTDIVIPKKLQQFMRGTKQSIPMSADFETFKDYLLQTKGS